MHAVYLHVLTEFQKKVMSEAAKLTVKFYMAEFLEKAQLNVSAQ